MSASHDVIDELLHPTIIFGGRARRFELRVPAVDEVLLSMSEPAEPGEERIERRLSTEALYMVESIDGDEITLDDSRALVRDTEALSGFARARNAIFETMREAGRMFAECPHCRRHEASLDLFALVAALHAGPWPIAHDNRIVLAAPSLATPWPKGKRPAGVATTSRIRFELPSAPLGIEAEATGGVLGDLDLDTGDREVAAWNRWAPRAVEQPEERSSWVYEEPGFRALLRLAISLVSLDGAKGEITPATLEPMPAPDFYFLDSLYWLTHNVDVPPSTTALIACGGCGQRFVPVR